MLTSLQTTTAENERQSWLKSGQAQLNTRMIGEPSVTDLARDVITILAEYQSAQIGAVDVALNDRLGETSQMLLRLEIEMNLLESAGGHVTSFLLPADFNGYLEVVRQIVDETIQRNVAAGLDVHGAAAALQTGDNWLALDDYVKAYGQYSKAYREAGRKIALEPFRLSCSSPDSASFFWYNRSLWQGRSNRKATRTGSCEIIRSHRHADTCSTKQG